MHVEAWGLNHSLYLPYVMHGRPSVAASFSLRPQDSLWDGAHDARLTGDVVDEILGGKVDLDQPPSTERANKPWIGFLPALHYPSIYWWHYVMVSIIQP